VIHSVAEAALDGGYEMENLLVTFEFQQLWHGHTAEIAHLAEVVALEIGDHHEFRDFLGRSDEVECALFIREWIGPPWARAFDGARANGATA
jgi:hypothetical protein